jgi:hypothetical protein
MTLVVNGVFPGATLDDLRARSATRDLFATAGAWTLDAGDSGRGSAVASGHLTLSVGAGASVPHDAGGGFHAPTALRALPSGGARGVRVRISWSSLAALDNRLAVGLRDATRTWMIALEINGGSNLIEFLRLAPTVSVFASVTVASVQSLALELVAGRFVAWYATTATPTEGDWRLITGLEASGYGAAQVAVSHVEISHPTYATTVATSTAVVTVCEMTPL